VETFKPCVLQLASLTSV